MPLFQTVSVLGSLAATVSAHGYVVGLVVAGSYYKGYSPDFQFENHSPTVIGWSDPENLSNGFVAPSAFGNSDIICHIDATPGGTSAKVAAGETVELQWNTWPESHHGPVLSYLAKCSGDCSKADKTTLEFFKISEGGLIDGSSPPGKWASDDLIANNHSWAVTIPTGIAAGNYVLRHEIIALHAAHDANGAQNYPQCINLEIISNGTDSPAGTLGTALYKEDDPGIAVNIYKSLATYTIPGPALYSGAASAGSQTEAPITSDAPVATCTSNASSPLYAAEAGSAASPTGSSSGETEWGSKPPQALPAGWTLEDMLELVAYVTKQSRSGERKHARDLFGAEDAAGVYGEDEPALPHKA